MSTSDSILNSQEFYLKRVSLDSVWACDSLYFAGIFFKEYYFEIFDKELLGQLNDKSKIYITSISTNKKYLPTDAKKEIVEDDGAFMFREVEIEKNNCNNDPYKVQMEFIKIKGGYKFYGVNCYVVRKCCNEHIFNCFFLSSQRYPRERFEKLT